MRLRISIIVFFLGFLAVTSRLFYWQIIKGSELSKQASYQYKGSQKIEVQRGSILANDGSWLAVTRTNWLLFVDKPNFKGDPEKVAEKLAPLLVDKEEVSDEALRISLLLSKSGLVWIPIKHKVTTSVKQEIEDLNIKGIGFEPEETRFYPEGSSSAQLLGFVGKNDKGEDVGYFGLEGYYDLSLKGKTGYISRERDLRGSTILSNGTTEITGTPGVDLETYIDKGIQTKVEEKLKDGIEKYGAKQGSVIIMEPKSGAVIAMASYPSYDPYKYAEFDQSLYKNPAISDTFEPGSVFKVIVMAAGLDAKVVEPDTICDICSGPLKVDKYFIETWDRKYHPDSTMADVIVHSDNVGMSFVAQKLGQERMYDYLSKFGIGKLTGIDLQGEANIPLRKKSTWSEVDLYTSSFGQGIATTPIQLARAVSAIANGGYLVTPKLVKNNVSSKDKIISEEASKDITNIMVESAKHGESKWTDLPGFKVAGKTGTAQIPIAGHYDAEKTIASFIGFAPANDPKFVMLVTLKEPQSSQWASETAAPLWYSIAKDLFNYFGVQPEN